MTDRELLEVGARVDEAIAQWNRRAALASQPQATQQSEEHRGPIDANVLEAMARARPNESFLKGSGVLKLTGAIRQLEADLRAVRVAQTQPDAAARLRFQRGVPGHENDMPTVVSCNWLPDGEYDVYLAGAETQAAPTAPEGWQLVPIEPTFEMRAAAYQRWEELDADITRRLSDRAYYGYRAMLRVAPTWGTDQHQNQESQDDHRPTNPLS